MKARQAKKIARCQVGRTYTKGQRTRALDVIGARLHRGCPRWVTDATGPRSGERMARVRKAVKRAQARGSR